MNYFFWTVGAILLCAVLTAAVKKMAVVLGMVDQPQANGRKIHLQPVPLLGGLAIFLSFFLLLWFAMWATHRVAPTNVSVPQLITLFIGAVVLMIGGWLDDRYNLKPWQQLCFTVLAVATVVWGGTNLKEITNPLGGTINLEWLKWGGRLLVVDGLVFFWLLGMTYTTKILDGLDGLVTGLTAIGSFMIGFLSLTEKFYQPDVALLAFIFAGANLGFLLWNWHPAKIFLGEGGSTLTGFILGFLAIAAGSKIATTLLVMGLPVLDLAVVAVRRWFGGRSPLQADSEHLHLRLLRFGWGQRRAVLFYYVVALVFGLTTLFFSSWQKFLALGVLLIIGLGLIIFLTSRVKKA